MYKEFADKLQKQLTRRIKGVIKVHIINDTLIIDILNRDDTTWHYATPNIAVSICMGLSTSVVADLVTKEFRKHILKTYFR